MHVLLMPNLEKPNAVACTLAVAQKLLRLDCAVELDTRFSELPALNGLTFRPYADALADCDTIVAIGGDGTFLHAAIPAVSADKPLLGINIGRLGFMAGLEMGELDLLSRLAEGKYGVEKRMLLDCAHQASGDTRRYLALNDAVLSNGSLSRIIDLTVSCGGRELLTYRADGVIFSTPTGSTAYALSAGGPIIDPSVNGICMTPICPHSLFNRATLFSENQTLSIRPAAANQSPIYLTVDGREGVPFGPDDKLEISKSAHSLSWITLKNQTFYETLGRKFQLYGSGGVALGESETAQNGKEWPFV